MNHTLSPEERAKSLGEKMFDAMTSAVGDPAVWFELSAEDQALFDKAGRAMCVSLSHYESAEVAIQALTARAEKAEALAKANEHDAQVWMAHAEKAEQQRDSLLDVLARVRCMFRLDLRHMLEFGKHYHQAVKDVHDAVEAALSPVTEEATDVG